MDELDLVLVISAKDRLDWHRLQRIEGVPEDAIYFVFNKNGTPALNANETVLCHFTENLPDKTIEDNCRNLFNLLPKKNFLAAIHKTVSDPLPSTLKTVRSNCGEPHLFSHEPDYPFWIAYEKVINCIENRNGFEDALQAVLKILKKSAQSHYFKEVLETLTTAALLLVSRTEDADLWQEIKTKAGSLSASYSQHIQSAGRTNITNLQGVETILSQIHDDPSKLESSAIVAVIKELKKLNNS